MASIGVLVIHGFTATPASVAVLEKPLRGLSVPVSMPLLAGHGASSPEALRGVTFHDWIESAGEAFGRLAEEAERIVVVGHSMGALLALQLAAVYEPSRVDSLVLAAPALKLSSPFAPGRPLRFAAGLLARFVKKWPLRPVYAEADYISCGEPYTWVPVEAVFSLFELIDRTVPVLGNVQVPVLILQNRGDSTVLPESAELLRKALGTRSEEKSVFWLERSEHQLFCDCERELASSTTTAFVSARIAKFSGNQ